ncbi:hypothetical protein CEW92_15450 [Bacillaceae bacterium SAS-127]|nr:hypothetical protein CEW92_15450 [Bacillaceae bacterium SAS-127]
MKYKIGKYVFLIASPICFYLFVKESFPYNYFYLLLTIWFLYMFINEQAELERVAAKTENLALVLLNIVVGVVPIISSALVFFFHEKSVTWLFIFMVMIFINLLIKILLQRENRTS